jgi:hypothetical protein
MKALNRYDKCISVNRTIYSYEQTGKHGKLFDVVVFFDSTVPAQFKINSRLSEKTADHEDIIRHFILEKLV